MKLPSIILAGLAVGMLGCSGGAKSSDTASKAKAASHVTDAVRVSLGDFFVRPRRSSVPAGRTLFQASNEGQRKHELVIVKTDAPPDQLPIKHGNVDEQAAGQKPGEVDDLKPGHKGSLAVSLEPGKYVLICNIPGHYRRGMHAAFTVR